MSTLIANPIYDSVFKYMIANDKVAKILLSALLKKNVVKVVQINNEYTIPYSDDISVCRIDFGATVSEEIKKPDGTTEVKESLVTIELQKAFLPSEVLRFRQYTGIHYCNPNNVHRVDYDVLKEASDPMISVYILGHRLDVIDECVCYVNREYCDYNGNKIDVKDPFAESLTHDTIIVQVPLLPNGNVKNRVEELLQVINQTNRTADQHFISIDEELYSKDEEMKEVIRTLKGAACDSKIRMTMRLEDEVFRDLKEKDLELRMMNAKLEKQQERLAEQKDKLAEQEDKLAEQEDKLAEQKDKLAEQEDKLAEQKDKLAEQKDKLAEQEDKLAEQEQKFTLIAQNLIKKNWSLAEIAEFMDLDEEYVKRLIK